MFECRGGPQYLDEYAKVRTEVFDHHRKTPKSKYTSRGLNTRYNTGNNDPLEGYMELVREINGDNLALEIVEQIVHNGSLDLLDVCCGRGRFLRELRWGSSIADSVRCYGITANNDYMNPLDPIDGYVVPFEQAFAGVEIRVGDAQDLGKIYQGQKFGLITAMWGLHYFADPLAPLQDIHNLLAPLGRAYVYACALPIENDAEREWFADFLREHGFSIDRPTSPDQNNIAIQRQTAEDLKFPLIYDGWNYRGPDAQARFMYQVKR